jgi:3-oxoacyl-[acyl-carrier protein] reductase
LRYTNGGQHKTAIREKIISNIPLKRLGQPEEIGRAALFILQDDYYNGRILEIDGGLRL